MTATSTFEPSALPTGTTQATATETATASFGFTETATPPAPTDTPTATAIATGTAATTTPTLAATATATQPPPTDTATVTAIPTGSAATVTPTATATGTAATETPTASPSSIIPPTDTPTPIPSSTPTATLVPSIDDTATPTPTPTPPATETPTIAASQTPSPTPIPDARVVLGSVDAEPGERVEVGVRLETLADITSLSIFFDIGDGATAAFDDDGRPICTVASEIEPDDSMFDNLPVGCEAEVDCAGIEAAILDTASPIPDGSRVFTCSIDVGADTAGQTIPLTCSFASVMGPPDFDVEAECIDGSIRVDEVSPTQGPGGTPTVPPQPTATGEATATREPLPLDDDGCQTTRAGDRAAWWMLAPMIPLWWRQRRPASL